MDEKKNRRLELYENFCNILKSKNVYFQPPENIKMNYPAIVYKLSELKQIRADNGVYLLNPRYTVILIAKEPDSDFVFKIAEIPTSKFVRHYVSDNLNHYIFEVY